MPTVGLIQTTASDKPEENVQNTVQDIRKAKASGATFILTPEVTNCVSRNRDHQRHVLSTQDEDLSLKAFQAVAAELGIWLLIGSLALKADDDPETFVNRSFLIDPAGNIAAFYDKIHMFDVNLSKTETFRESDSYRAGARAVVADCDFGRVGLSVCYDLRFPHLYRDLAKANAQILTVPAAFSPISGAAHWHVLLRARAIETGCFILAPAQTGTHKATTGKPRQTYGHSLVVKPWGEIIADAGPVPGLITVELDLKEVDIARRRIPSLHHDQTYKQPS